jgi:ferrous iron transport protein B
MASCCQSQTSCCDNQIKPLKSNIRAALVGNPNCGKTTLFNALTGARQRVGNWPGVTVERKCGYFTEASTAVEVVDLPGIYSLTMASATSAIDEKIAIDFLYHCQADVIVNIIDASNLERHLYLTTQLLEMGVPMIVALNMMDVALARNIHINVDALAKQLGCPVIALTASKGGGIQALKRALVAFDGSKVQPATISYGSLEPFIQQYASPVSSQHNQRWLAMRLLEGDEYVKSLVPAQVIKNAEQVQRDITLKLKEDADILFADARYRFASDVVKASVSAQPAKATWTTYLDHLFLNRVLGIPIFLAIMYSLFFFSINVGGAFQDFFDISSQTIFVDCFAVLLTNLGFPTWLTVLLANGVGKGINTTITFVPVIGAMFVFLAFLEDSGYMARAAFVVDRLMRMLGLPGKAFVPMIVGFGCNVPAVMGARTLDNPRDRILTIMMSPFMSCGARLAIFAVFTAAFFPQGGQNVVFALYLIGIFMAVLTGFLLRATVLKGEPSPLVMELPPYHLPHVKTLLIHAWQRLRAFVVRAGRYIVPICVLIGALNSFNLDGTINSGDGDTHSLLSIVGQWVTPIFSPMGLHVDNWPATVGLVTGVLAKEVVVGTLNTLYTQMGHFASAATGGQFSVWAGLHAAWQSIPANLAALGNSFSNPVLAKAPIEDLSKNVYGLMYQRFDGQAGAFAYLLFVLLYFPCISTMAAMLRELHRGWSIFSAFWMTGVAYATAVVFYQAATFMRHPLSSAIWIVLMVAAFVATIYGMRWFASRRVESRKLEAAMA